MARPAPLSGFPEFLPAERVVEQQVLDSLRRTFELYGFSGLETRAVEPLSVLLRKGEIDKEVYVVRRLHAEPSDEEADSAGSADGLALHYDLTVPFARYVLENAGKLQFPFRRYQIQKVWRGERPQEGRYREFLQADIDVVDRDTLAPHHDVEMARVMTDALSRLPLPAVRLQVNNRKLVEGFYRGLGIEDTGGVMRVVDKLDKVGQTEAGRQLSEDLGLDERQVEACLRLPSASAADASFADRVRDLGVKDPLLDEGVDELVAVLEGCAEVASERVSVVADLSVARGLDYYTGTVYETRLEGFEHLGSVCSGGRYDALASDGSTTYPGVGISFGVTRTLAPLLQRGLLTASRPVPTAVVVAVVDEEHRAASDRVAAALRARGVPAEVSPTAAKFGKQIRYADRRGVPFVWFPSEEGHQVKDIRSGEQVDADPGSWEPPGEDLRPSVRVQD